MQLTPYVTAVEDSLEAAAAAGDDTTRRAAAALTAALEPAVRLALMSAVSELAAEASDTLGDRIVDVRLDGGDLRVVVSSPSGLEEAFDEADEEPPDAGGEPSRVTLRLPEELKLEAERAAARHGVSLNTWLARAVRDALRTGTPASEVYAKRVRGWIQS